ncbi:MAG: hypothetical protein R8M71_01090 [Alphaproteobacteria bacterium]|nr:hypothetical protein [Alphaproteobacteria bacterium]
MAKSMYDIIKKQNGERFAKAIRNYDNGIFDIPNIDKIVKYAGRDAEPIMNYLVSLKQIKIQEMAVHMDPIELLDKAGYEAYVADTLEKQNAIKKYYAPGEELCTFRDPERFERYYIINAVRKDVDKIKRGNPPQRDDEYGTSVISIQVLKTGGFISIKNRYNHTVQNCDSTLNSNPDNIIMGLSDAIRHHFGADFSSQRVDLGPGYTLVGNQICKYYREINNVYISEDFYVKDGRVYEIDKNTQIALGNGLIFDLKHEPYMSRFRNVTGEYVFNIDYLIKDRPVRILKNDDGSKALYAGDEHILSFKDGKMCYINPKDLANFSLRYATLKGDLDFSKIRSYLSLENSDLSGATSLKLPLMFGGSELPTSMNLEGVIFPAVELNFDKFRGSLTLKRADMSRVTKLVLPNNGDTMDLSGTKMPACPLDLSHLTQIMLHGADLSQVTDLKLSKDFTYIDLEGAKMGVCELDLGHLNRNARGGACQFNINNADLSRVTKLVLPENLLDAEFGGVKFPSCELNLSSLLDCLKLQECDLSHVTRLVLPKDVYTSYIYIDDAKFPATELDFSNASSILSMERADLSRVKKLVMPKTIADVYATDTVFPACELNLENIATDLNFRGADMSRVKKLVLPSGYRRAYFGGAKFPACELDLSKITGVIELSNADLSRVTKLILPEDKSNVQLDGAKLPVSYKLELAKQRLQDKMPNINEGTTYDSNQNCTNER